ncbi:hypothetical protein HYQ45_001361 [Verticillium longisporum]|uniref:Uncharacterized protein n=3 Tax=Verticillium TaxID=1036719 RepID=G2XDJ3_VERDV|nr:uncharacterized protein VDAG_08225 [Verticillium dahliae VdLs.17]KAF3347739.1 hypothetical protein VdG2_03975 [Verticillium dahliae VDG2]KAF3356339.1 hypothetical protein VdG1_06433 [Verticillium dahliae VDG1]KAG7142289.1 hypothetical protein HYQ45_001361 [Verticillium longisporum]KAH6696059.1 hypothetical protein EV126DRAFT_508870 [Verticillium dahliae]EGY17061.1 hypothetical protein VDAG_08225 [Verticillium dahliae VdLs.17]
MSAAGAKSVISNDMQELGQGKEDISNKISGHKANLSNPNTSEESKENSKKAIEELGGPDNHYGKEDVPRSKSAADALEGSRVV